MASKHVRRHPLVFRDVVGIAEYIAADSTDAAVRFLDNVEATISGILDLPGKGALCEFSDPTLADVRFWTVDGFPNHLVFYRRADYGIYVLSVRHGARMLPGDLSSRAPSDL